MSAIKSPGTGPGTRISTSTTDTIRVGGRDLIKELIGEYTYTEMLYFLTCGNMPRPEQTRILDACLVTLMEHGLTPSAVIARLMADSVPDEPQVAISAGLLAIGSVFAGTTEQCAHLLLALELRLAAGDKHALRDTALEYARNKSAVPGFGHASHKPDDPRSARLFAVAQKAGVNSRYADLLQKLSAEVDLAYGRHLTINATGAIGALLLEIGIPVKAMRSYSVVSRAGGLVGHLLEEQRSPSARAIWKASKEAVPYSEPDAEAKH